MPLAMGFLAYTVKMVVSWRKHGASPVGHVQIFKHRQFFLNWTTTFRYIDHWWSPLILSLYANFVFEAMFLWFQCHAHWSNLVIVVYVRKHYHPAVSVPGGANLEWVSGMPGGFRSHSAFLAPHFPGNLYGNELRYNENPDVSQSIVHITLKHTVSSGLFVIVLNLPDCLNIGNVFVLQKSVQLEKK